MTSNTNPEHRTQVGTGHFMLTLCRLAAPVSIRPPQAPQLRPFTFFTSREREPDGSEGVYLHMGYFETLADAERWAEAVHGRFPEAIATVAPAAPLPALQSDAPSVQATDPQPEVTHSRDYAPVEDSSLTDTRVMKILETRDGVPVRDDADAGNSEQIALLRPEDTSTRVALKEAVVQGAPVSFAVQLHWSPEPIDLKRVPSLPIFKGYTLYANESRREGRSRYFLRLGFFGDPISAKQFAAQLRANFASAAVVPVAEQEVTSAREAALGSASIPYLVQQRADPVTDFERTAPESKPSSEVPRRTSQTVETLEQTLERLAQREIWTNPDSLSESGVRHLRVEDVQERTPGRPHPPGRSYPHGRS
jgi:hypothetical protein